MTNSTSSALVSAVVEKKSVKARAENRTGVETSFCTKESSNSK
jgi:hypothetical protein